MMSENISKTKSPAIEPETARIIRRILIKWGKENYQNFPWRNAAQPWHALVAEVLLQRTRAKNVVPVYLTFVEKFKHPTDLHRVDLKQIEDLIYPLGLKWRAPLIKNLGMELAARDGIVPDNLEELLLLPAVGTYAASAWLSFHGNKRAVIIDTNVVRLICRLIDVPMDGETRRKKWLIQTADLLTPRKAWKDYNYAVLDFTMQICTKIPKCPICPLLKYCAFGRKSISDQRAQQNET
jgi:A/G-specific adenine glycosylase